MCQYFARGKTNGEHEFAAAPICLWQPAVFDIHFLWHPFAVISAWFDSHYMFNINFLLTSFCFHVHLLWYPFALTSHRVEIPFHGRIDFNTLSFDYRLFKRTRAMLQSAGSDWYPQIIRGHEGQGCPDLGRDGPARGSRIVRRIVLDLWSSISVDPGACYANHFFWCQIFAYFLCSLHRMRLPTNHGMLWGPS